MSYSVHDGSDLEQALRRLGQRMSSLTEDVEELQSRHHTLDSEVTGINERVSELETELQEAQDTQQRLADDLHENMATTATAVRALAATVGWLERRLRAERDVPRAPLDEADAMLQNLAQRARQGRQSAAVLLEPFTRTMHQQRIDALTELEEQIETERETALQHSAALATTAPGTTAHTTAAAGYRITIKSLVVHQAQLPTVRAAAAEAQKALNLDDKHREVHGPQVMTGESARAQLMARLRARLDVAVAEAALLPAWLVLSLGHQPVGEDVAGWMDTATSLLAYRVIYEVVDPVVALGPNAHDDPHRESWHQDLGRRLKARRTWPI